MTTPLTSSDPTTIGPFTLAARIDAGGQGIVYLGHAADGSPAAVKVLTGAWGDDARQRERFARELAAARTVAPFCTAAVLDADMDAAVPYIASEYVPGPTLRSAVLDEGPRTGAALDRLAIATITALTAVHEAGVVHRDLKPGNVILGPDGPRVIDFGIARFTDATQQTTSVAGTPAYMAPEQIRGDQSAASGDVFSWAAVMTYAATGRHAFPGENTMAVIDRVLSAPPDLTDVPERLLPVLERCLDKDPAARPTAAQVLDGLLGRSPAAAAPVARTVVLEQATTAVDDGTARIRLPAAGWLGGHVAAGAGTTSMAPAGVGSAEGSRTDAAPVGGEPTDVTPRGEEPTDIASTGVAPADGASGRWAQRDGTTEVAPSEGGAQGATGPWNQAAGSGYADDTPAHGRWRGLDGGGAPAGNGGAPAEDAGAPGYGGARGSGGVPVTDILPGPRPSGPGGPVGGRRGSRRRTGSGLVTAGAVTVLAALTVLLLWVYNQNGPGGAEPTGSIPSGVPVEDSPTEEQETTGQEEPAETVEEVPVTPYEEETDEPVWTPPTTDCHTDPHAPGCTITEPDVCDYDPASCEGGSGDHGDGDGTDGGEGDGTDDPDDGDGVNGTPESVGDVSTESQDW